MKKQTLAIAYMGVDGLIPYARNSRTHSADQVAQIAASIKEFGFTNPVLIDEDGGIIAGHGRILAARKLRMDLVPTILLEGLTETQRRAYVIADNKLALNAGWDDDMLRVELESLRDADFDMTLLGFGDQELADMLAADEGTEGLTDPDDAPAVEDAVASKPGDVWVMGKHRVMCGDSTSADAVITLCGGGVFGGHAHH